jgi:hypothetical protein
MIEKTKTYIIIGLAIALVGVTLFFVMGKGIIINKQTYNTNHQEQLQYQGQISVNFFQAYGSKLKWKYVEYDNKEDALVALNLLPPEYSYFSSKPFRTEKDKWANWIPEFMTETKK